MKAYENLNAMRDDIITYALNHNIEDDTLRTAIQGAVSMDLTRIGGFIETVYNLDERDPELAQIAAGAAGVFALSGFLDIGKDGTANGMRLAMLREAGEPAPLGMTWPTTDKDPPKKAAEPDGVPPAPPAQPGSDRA